MTNTPSLPPGGEKQADQVEAVARALDLAMYMGLAFRPMSEFSELERIAMNHDREKLRRWARAALSASKPLVVEECARVADAFAERMARASEKPHPITGKKNRIAPMKEDAAITIAKAIRALKESPSEGSGG